MGKTKSINIYSLSYKTNLKLPPASMMMYRVPCSNLVVGNSSELQDGFWQNIAAASESSAMLTWFVSSFAYKVVSMN